MVVKTISSAGIVAGATEIKGDEKRIWSGLIILNSDFCADTELVFEYTSLTILLCRLATRRAHARVVNTNRTTASVSCSDGHNNYGSSTVKR